MDEIEQELKLCNKTLLEITGIAPTITAFPNGNFNDKVIEVTKKAGFRLAFTVNNQLNILPLSNSNITCLNRFMALPLSVRKYAGLNRLGYSPDSLFENLKSKFHVAYK